MKFINLKMTEKSKEDMKGMNKPIEYCGPKYPYGLGISFDEESIDKIEYLQKVGSGQECEFMCKGFVSRVNTNEDADDKGDIRKRKNVAIQITDISFDKGERPEEMLMREYSKMRGKSA